MLHFLNDNLVHCVSLRRVSAVLALSATSDSIVGWTKWFWVERGIHLTLGEKGSKSNICFAVVTPLDDVPHGSGLATSAVCMGQYQQKVLV